VSVSYLASVLVLFLVLIQPVFPLRAATESAAAVGAVTTDPASVVPPSGLEVGPDQQDEHQSSLGPDLLAFWASPWKIDRYGVTAFGRLGFATLLILVSVLYWNRRLRREIKARKQVEEDLRLAKETLNAVPMHILWYDLDKRVVMANQAVCEVIGLELEELTGKHMLELNCSLDQEDFEKQWIQVVNNGYAIYYGHLHHSDGSCHPTEEKLVLVELDDKRYVVSIGQDITQRLEEEKKKKAQEQELLRAKEAAEAGSRMKSEFIANMNHEVRTPMNAIIGYAEMLANGSLSEDEKRFARIIRKSGEVLIAILNDVMDLSKIESGRLKISPAPVRLQSIVAEVEELFVGQAMDKKLRFSCTVDPSLPSVFLLDGLRFKQILTNLVGNGIKFTHQGSVSLHITGTAVNETGESYDLQVTVQDTGIGIPEENRCKIFELFQSYDEDVAKSYGGVGLGLTICSRLVGMMGGSLDLASEEGQGSVFTLRLPGIQVGQDQVAAVVMPETSVGRGGDVDRPRRILVVDDMEIITDVVSDYYGDGPPEVLVADNGEDALKLAVERQPGLILMDLNLAGVDGREVTERLRQDPVTASIPVVVMSGTSMEPEEYLPLFDGFLAKPFSLDDLHAMVCRFIDLDGPDEEETEEADLSVGDLIRESSTVIQHHWNEELATLYRLAYTSGSLSAASRLGSAMRRQGDGQNIKVFTVLGEKLEQFAAEPDIVGVEYFLEQLTTHIFQ